MSDNKTVLLPPCSEDHNSVAAPGDKKAEVGSTCVDVATGGGDSDSGGSLSSSVSPIPPGSSTIPDDWNGVEQSDADSGVANGSTPFDCDSSLLSLNSSCASGDGSACLTTSPTVLVENACQSLSGDDGSLIATAVMNEPIANAAGDTLSPASAQTKIINVSTAHDSCNRHSANNNNSGSVRSNGETVTVGAPARDTTPNETGTQQQYVVNVHVNAGETFSVRVGDRVQLIHGPATVRMVSNSGPPVPMPMQVPPGHMVQQIVDENGILTHVILSPQPPGIPAPPTMMGAPNCAPVYPAFGPSYAPFPPHFAAHYPGIAARHMHPMMGSHLHHGSVPTAAAVPPQPHHHQCSSHLHHPSHVHTPVSTPQTAHRANHVPTVPAPPQQPSIDDRTMRTRARLRNKLGRRKPSESSIQRKGSNAQRTASSESHEVQVVQADSKSGNNSSFDDNQEPDEEMKIIHDLLSKLEPPKVLDIEAKSALIQLSMPIINQAEVDVDASEFIYELSLSEKVDNGFMVFYSGDATEITLRDLKPATDYFVRVCCLLDNIRGDPAKPVSFRTSAAEPEAPQSPKLQAKAKTHLQLKWTPPADNGSKITLYSLEYDQGKGDAKFVEVYCGPQKQFKVPKLSPSTSYAFRLVAINAIGRSRYSETVVYCTSGTVPLQTDPPMLSECCVKALTISWVRRPCDETFTLQMEDEATGHGFLNVYNGPELSHKIAQLRRNTEYKFRLAATNEEGTGKWSEVVCFRTLPDRPQPPPRPQLKGRLTSNSFRVVWDEPKDTGGVDVQDYQVQLDAGNGYQMAHRTAEREFVAEQLEPGHTYRIRICCYSSGGQSDWSEVLIVTTQAVAPGQCKPPRLHGRPKSTFVTVAWEYPEDDGGSTITEYAVIMSGNELGSQREVYRGHDTQCSVASLLPGRTYSLQVRACNKAGWGTWSEALEVLTSAGVPDAPCRPEVHCKSPHVATISWEEPPCNGSTVSEYHLEWQLHEEQDFSVLYAGPCNVYELNKLTPATSYGFRVQALNSVGAGPFSPVSWCQTLASSPSAVTSVRVSSTETSLCISWKEPVCNGSKVTSYNIDIGDPMRPLIAVDANTLDYTVTDLQPETAYKIRVQAVNAIGIGAFSAPVKVTTRALPPNPPTIECVMIGSNSLKLKWGDGKNPDLIRFCLEMRRENISFQAVYQGTGHMHKVTKLNESTTYQFRIFASNDAGDGPVSPIYSYCTTKAPPAAMKAPKVTEMNVTSCTIEWALPKPSSSDSLVYVLQLQRMLGKDQDYHEVYRGTARSFHLENLTTNSDYQVRVCAVRNLVNESGATVSLTGPFSPGTPFTTLGSPKSSAELNQVQASGSSSKPVMVSGAAGLTDQAWACILLMVFAVIAVGVAFFAQQIIN